MLSAKWCPFCLGLNVLKMLDCIEYQNYTSLNMCIMSDLVILSVFGIPEMNVFHKLLRYQATLYRCIYHFHMSLRLNFDDHFLNRFTNVVIKI